MFLFSFLSHAFVRVIEQVLFYLYLSHPGQCYFFFVVQKVNNWNQPIRLLDYQPIIQVFDWVLSRMISFEHSSSNFSLFLSFFFFLKRQALNRNFAISFYVVFTVRYGRILF